MEVVSVIRMFAWVSQTVLLFPTIASSRRRQKTLPADVLALGIPLLHIEGGVEKGDLMPTLFRFMFFCASMIALVYGAMFALVVLVEPRERDVVVRIPSERVNPQQP